MYYFPTLVDHLLVLLFGLAIPFLSGVRSRDNLKDIQFTPRIRQRFYLVNSGFLAGAAGVVSLSWLWQGRSLAMMGFRAPENGTGSWLVWALSILVIILYLVDTLISFRQNQQGETPGSSTRSMLPFLPASASELPAYIVLCLSAGVFEEIIYRGFVVNYFLPEHNLGGGSVHLAALAPALLFSLAHYYQGALAVLKIFVLSLLLGLIFILSRSLWIVMALHVFIDLSGGLFAMHYLRKSKPQGEPGSSKATGDAMKEQERNDF